DLLSVALDGVDWLQLADRLLDEVDDGQGVQIGMAGVPPSPEVRRLRELPPLTGPGCDASERARATEYAILWVSRMTEMFSSWLEQVRQYWEDDARSPQTAFTDLATQLPKDIAAALTLSRRTICSNFFEAALPRIDWKEVAHTLTATWT